MADSTRGTGNDPIEGADPGGTHSTRPGNPDRSRLPKPGQVTRTVESGDGDAGRQDAASTEPGTHRDTP